MDFDKFCHIFVPYINNVYMKDSSAIYVNRDNNTCYHDDEIFETSIETTNARHSIINLFSKLLCDSYEESLIFATLVNVNFAFTISAMCKKLSADFGKSERTYRRAIECLLKKNVIQISEGTIIINQDYDISKYDLTNLKSIMIHINKI